MLSFLTPLLAGFALTALLTPGVIWLAQKLGWVAKPREDRWHKRPTALMGGIAIFAGTLAAWLGASLPGVLPIVIGPATAIFLLGWIDDRVRLRPHVKFIGQLVAAAVVVLCGVQFQGVPPLVALPLTVFFVVGITNAVNLLDNMDGLAAGVSGISALVLAAYSAATGNMQTAVAALALAGACGGFLIYNFNPARIFMGDCGSMFIGFTLAVLAVHGTERSAPHLALSMFVPVAVLAIPIFDTTLVSVARTLHGRSISQGGRDHSSHRLVSLGLSERATVLVLYGLTAAFGVLAVISTQVRLLTVAVLALLLFSALAVLGLYLGIIKVYSESARALPDVRLLGGTILYKRQLLQVLLDIPLVGVAFVGAQTLRFEGAIPADITRSLPTALLVVLTCKLVGLAICRAYRGVWRFAGMADALTAVAGSTLGSLLAAMMLVALTGLQDLSRAALVIDWMLFTILAVAVRTGYAALRQLFAMVPDRSAPRVLILGAGAEGLALASRLRDPQSPCRAQVLGILDDDLGKRGCSINGVPVLGPLRSLPDIIRDREVSACLIGVQPTSEAGRRILGFCQDRKVALYRELDADPLFMEAADPEPRAYAHA